MGEDGRPDLINRDPNNLNGSLTVSIFLKHFYLIHIVHGYAVQLCAGL